MRNIVVALVTLLVIWIAVPLEALAGPECKDEIDPQVKAILERRLERIRQVRKENWGEQIVVVADAAPPANPVMQMPVVTSEAIREVAVAAKDSPASKSKWDSFHEVSAYAGAYKSLGADSKGLWIMGEWVSWHTDRMSSSNYGIGLTAKADRGWGENGSRWGSFAVGPNLDYWTELAPNQYFLAKARPLYRWNENGGYKSSNGFMPGAYLEYSNAFARNDTFIAALEGQYFRNDSFLGLNLMIEHRVNKDVKIKYGMSGSIQGGGLNENVLGFGPTLSVKLYNRFVFGTSLNFIKGGPTLGLFAGYEINTDLIALDAMIREKSVKQESQGVTTAMPMPSDDVKVRESGENFITLPGANNNPIQFSGSTMK